MLHLLNLIIKMHTIQVLIFHNICNLASNSLPFYWLTIIFIYIYIYCGVLKIIQDQLVLKDSSTCNMNISVFLGFLQKNTCGHADLFCLARIGKAAKSASDPAQHFVPFVGLHKWEAERKASDGPNPNPTPIPNPTTLRSL